MLYKRDYLLGLTDEEKKEFKKRRMFDRGYRMKP